MTEMPPLGVAPRKAATEQRIRDLVDAIQRRTNADYYRTGDVMLLWIDELKELVSWRIANDQ